MATAAQQPSVRPATPLERWIPLLVLPVGAFAIGPAIPWVQMWALAAAIFSGLKWLTLTDLPSRASIKRIAAYLLAWPGLDAHGFLSRTAASPRLVEFTFAIGKLTGGITAFLTAAYLVDDVHPLLSGWLGMIGIAFMLHFGLFHLLSCFWRHVGVQAVPLMRAPILATSVRDFWGRRWNTAFRDVAQRYVFRPIVRRCGPNGATIGVFLFSGLIHDLVISLPARAGWGLPTLYFLIQAGSALAERTDWGSNVGLGRGVRGRLFALLAVVLPVPLLFHTPFIERVMVPMLRAVKEVL